MKRLEWCFDSAMPDYWDFSEEDSQRSQNNFPHKIKNRLNYFLDKTKYFVEEISHAVYRIFSN